MDELKKYGSNIYVNEYEKNVLIKCNIDVTKCNNLSEVLLLIDMYLNEVDVNDLDYEEIDYVANILNERQYYMSHK